MIKKIYSDLDVVTAARRRIKNTFESAKTVSMNYSGGKDSICLDDLVYKLCLSGEVEKEKLIINFIDEEAIYPCVEEIVKQCRLKWLSIGVRFDWYAMQYKHYTCFKTLTAEESYLCWDETQKDVWIRPKPKFAIGDDPLLNVGVDNYQSFLDKKFKNIPTFVGLRASESVQRYTNIANGKKQNIMLPIYDWKDTDVWQYIRDNELDFPIVYEYLYRVGVPMNNMRISQFFSVDTAMNLVKICEFYPGLFDRICKREPNAYLAAMYYDSEMFRRNKQKKKEDVNWKEEFFKVLSDDWRFNSKETWQNRRALRNLALNYGLMLKQSDWKKMYEIIVAGDPKRRNVRSVYQIIGARIREAD